jgi:biotin carboxylase
MSRNNLRPAIIHIGGGFFQARTIQWAKEAGFYVAVTDKNPECAGAVLADRFVNIAGDDIDAMMELSGELSLEYSFKGVWCHADFCLITKAKVQEAFGIGDLSPGSVALALDKDSAKKIWIKHGIDTPQSRLVNSKESALAAAIDIGFPVVFKPLKASGSMGVNVANEELDVLSAYSKAASHDYNVVVEAFVSGREFGVNGIFHAGVFYPAGISERRTIAGTCMLNEVIVPASLPSETEISLYGILKEAALSIGINNGCVKGDCIVTGDRPYILEISPRLHGNPTMSHAMPMAAGISPVKIYFEMLKADKEKIYDMKQLSFKMFAGYRPIFCKSGMFKEMKGVDEAKKISGVESIELFVKQGSKMVQYGDNRDIIGYVFGKAASVEGFRSSMDEAFRRLQIVVS